MSHEADPLDAEPLHCLVGPTASGKTEVATLVAERAGAEILSLDSMLVYRGLDVGTAKPAAAELARVRHHLIDRVEPSERYDTSRWLADAREALGEVRERGARALFAGGTGLYLAALLRGIFEGPPADLELRARIVARARAEGSAALHAELARRDPLSAERIHPNDEKRVVRALEVAAQTRRALSAWQQQWSGTPSPRERRARLVGLRLSRAALEERIARRTRAMLDSGWREEAVALRARGALGDGARQALGYAEVLAWADGELDRETAEQQIRLRTRQLARRQATWLRKFPIRWIEVERAESPEELAEAVREALGW